MVLRLEYDLDLDLDRCRLSIYYNTYLMALVLPQIQNDNCTEKKNN